MRWRLRDATREVQLCDPFQGKVEGDLTALPRDEAAAMLRWLGSDQHNADVLRELQAARRRSNTAPPTSADFFIVAPTPLQRVLEEVDRGSLVVLVGPERIADAEVFEEVDTTPVEAEPLAVEAPQEQAPVPPDVVAQVQALQRAAEVGAPFCEE